MVAHRREEDGPIPLSLNAWAVLALLVDDGPNHGFALARELARGTTIGQVWAVPRPLVYRALEQLAERGLARAGAEQPGDGGPTRRAYRATVAGRRAVAGWRLAPVTRLRAVRPDLILKLVLDRRAGIDVAPLLEAQRTQFADLARQLRAEERTAAGPEQVVAIWRSELASAVERTIRRLEHSAPQRGHDRGAEVAR